MPLSETELKDARNLFKIFLQAWKYCGLYPEGHTASRRTLESLMSAFTDFFSQHGNIELVVEKERLLWRDGVIHEVPPENSADDIIFPLYRDGVTWIEFQQGLPLKELALFFNILNKYKYLQEETGGDIVTELIDEDLAYITFKVVDILWQDYPLLDFSSLITPAAETGGGTPQSGPEETKLHERGETSSPETLWQETSAKTSADGTGGGTPQKEPEETELTKSTEHSDPFAKSITDPSYSETLWEISTDEHEALQKMIQEEENLHNSEDVFDVLVTILKSQDNKFNFSSVLDFTLEEVVESIEQGEFDKLPNLFHSLYHMDYRVASHELPWIGPLIGSFFQDLSKPEIFAPISAKLLTFTDNDINKTQRLQQMLLYFPPDVILLLGPLIPQTNSQEVRKMILEVIEHLCLIDFDYLEKLLANTDKQLGEALLPILQRLQGERAINVFLKMVEHPSEKVRVQASKTLLAQNSQNVEKLFFLIDDPSEAVRKELLAAIAKQKSSRMETLLLKYMKETLEQKDPEHIQACYKALGCCGSVTAVQFLKRILLSQSWNRFTGFGKPLHREAAATALALMDTGEARAVLHEASQSKHQVIRQALQKAMAGIAAQPGNSHG